MTGRRRGRLIGAALAVLAAGVALVPFDHHDWAGEPVSCGTPVTAAFKDPSSISPGSSAAWADEPRLLDPSAGYGCVHRGRERLVVAGGLLALAGLGVFAGRRAAGTDRHVRTSQ